jgi:hypothetical protein
MEITKKKLKDWIEDLDGCCVYWACEGHSKPPVDMLTCRVCRVVWEMKQTIKIQ